MRSISGSSTSRGPSSPYSFRPLAALRLSPSKMGGFWLQPSGDALCTDAFGAMDSRSKGQELLIEFLEVLKLIN
jgi:hypothetical protein